MAKAATDPVDSTRDGTQSGLIVRETEPLNLEMPFSSVDDFVTPNESFYVRCHFPMPEIAGSDWRLQIEGDVEHPFELSYEQLRAMKLKTLFATLECAGNNRRFLEPKMSGVQWGQGAVGNAAWRGVPLADLLTRARPKAEAIEVILEGADQGPLDKPGAPPGEISFARSVPLKKAVADVLLAYEMNGEELSQSHGFPLRAVVPGWYAMASIKWLRRIIVSRFPFTGYYQTLDYAYWDRSDDLPKRTPLSEMQVKAQISHPQAGARLPVNSTVRINGSAWSAGSTVSIVEVSTDGGLEWSEANLLGEPRPNAWQLFEYTWKTSALGKRSLMARATDSLGRTQPLQHDHDRGSYMINYIMPVEVEIIAN